MSNSFATPWTIARQAPSSMGFSRHEYWSGLPLPSPGDLPNPGVEPQVSCIASRFFFTAKPLGTPFCTYITSQFFKCSNSYMWLDITVTESETTVTMPKSRIGELQYKQSNLTKYYNIALWSDCPNFTPNKNVWKFPFFHILANNSVLNWF